LRSSTPPCRIANNLAAKGRESPNDCFAYDVGAPSEKIICLTYDVGASSEKIKCFTYDVSGPSEKIKCFTYDVSDPSEKIKYFTYDVSDPSEKIICFTYDVSDPSEKIICFTYDVGPLRKIPLLWRGGRRSGVVFSRRLVDYLNKKRGLLTKHSLFILHLLI
jgi:hypothetical protein